jgi:hypothetical protein
MTIIIINVTLLTYSFYSCCHTISLVSVYWWVPWCITALLYYLLRHTHGSFAVGVQSCTHSPHVEIKDQDDNRDSTEARVHYKI